ncbi:MAG: MFS transporter [Saprospiraceae bacterium]|nr:MFS transporter [Saprospiraceae bacterium]
MVTTADPKTEVLAAEDKVSLWRKILYGSGCFADMTFQWTLIAFALPIFNMELGYSPAIIGLVLAITRIWDAVTDPLMGSISDNARTRFGRRRPFIGIGAILAGLFFISLWFIPPGLSNGVFIVYFTIASILFYTSFTIFSVPLYAMGYEMSADYHERTKIMGVRIFANSLNGIILFPWFLLLVQSSFWANPIEGIRMVGLGIGVVMIILGLIPALTLKEKVKNYVDKQERVSVFKSLKFTFTCKPFVYLVLAFFAALFAYNTVASTYVYPLRYFVCAGDAELYSFWFGWIEASHHIATLAMLAPLAFLSRKIGKRMAATIAPIFLIIGSITYLFCFVPGMPWLVLIPRVLIAMGIAGLFVLVPSMIADVVDYDERLTGTRREGMFGAVHFWVLKLALAFALGLTGVLVNATGFDVALGVNQPANTMNTMILLLGVVPTIGAVVAMVLIGRYQLTEGKMQTIRAELEARRGVD